ncbi:MAG TPA: sigma-70 family RNA polymerase sigma factor [Candidatus Dormibacteraeota bacterium]|nr:sigma-70 family RNA polymerase sigma factor [Candidatus Dormibacteraeota bacterium]
MALTEPVDDASDFEAAIRMETGRLFGVAYSILRDVGEAEDAVQEAMAQAWRSWSSLRNPEKRAAWLRQICVRCAIRMRRRILPRAWLDDRKDVDRYPTPESDPDLDRSFRRLSPRQRAVVALHFEYGYTLDECAELIGCAPGTARSHLARALASMRKELGHE